MKTLRIVPALACAAALLAGCAQNAASPSSSSGSSFASSQSSSSTASSATSLNEDILASRYIDISTLPMLDLDVEESVQFDDRTLVLEDSIDNELEYLVYQTYYYKTSADFTARQDLLGDNESLQISNHSEEKNFKSGKYMTSITLHALNTLTYEDLEHTAAYVKEDLLKQIDQSALTEYAIVQVDLDWTYSQAQLEAGPQLGEGRYLRYFLLGKTEKTPEFRWYELYWDDFLEEA